MRGQKASGTSYGVDPGAGGRFMLEGKDGLIFAISGAADTRCAPDPAALPLATSFMVMNSGTQSLDINTSSGTTIATIQQSEAAVFFNTQASGGNAWVAHVMGTGVTS